MCVCFGLVKLYGVRLEYAVFLYDFFSILTKAFRLKGIEESFQLKKTSIRLINACLHDNKLSEASNRKFD
ncbi:hypothetical protein RJT34_18658 [Clitoria ternatea]|uniref:Uncharacterized protein n=1 Tax=Clitoria ternatea TaxID=43366 RepID=A0AAN9PER8_CLITE